MAQLAIKGHPTRGREVIQLLEMLGGVNKYQIDAIRESYVYFVDKDGIIRLLQINQLLPNQDIVYSLEEFLEKFPYKVGDKVTLDKYPCIITEMYWEYDDVIYYLKSDDFSKGVYSTDKDLQPYKEETMEEKEDEPKAPILSNRYDYAEGKCGYVIPDGYEFDYIKEGFQTEIILKPKKPTYPKYYTECEASELSLNPVNVALAQGVCMGAFAKLIVLRNAYWEIAGKQLGLDKPWKPKHEYDEEIFFIYCDRVNGINKGQGFPTDNFCLSFPTEEMRDAFYENFKEEIEMCKELL